MKTIVILMALLFVGLTSNAQERSRAAWLRVNEIMERNGWDREKAVLEYQRMHRAEIHHVEDEFYFGRDTLYLLWDAQDSLSFRDSRGRYKWRLYDPKDTFTKLPRWEWKPTPKYISLYERLWCFRLGWGVSLTDRQLASLRPASRRELADFFHREIIRESRKNDERAALISWGLWNLLDYFPKVYLIIPKGGDFYDLYECEFGWDALYKTFYL